MGGGGLELPVSEQEELAGCCEHGDKLFVSIKSKEFLV
jgi:hypothetical protein